MHGTTSGPPERGEREEGQVSQYDSISPTALLIAYERTFSDIPWSKEVYAAADGTYFGGSKSEPGMVSAAAPRYEARYKLVNRLIEERGDTHVLEIAPGIAPRGLAYTQADPSLRYVAFDLPHMTTAMAQILQAVRRDYGVWSPNLVQVSGDALRLNSLQRAVHQFAGASSLTVVVEGLMRYLNMQEKEQLATNILSILRQVGGGAWITPDISLRSIDKGAMSVVQRQVSSVSGIDFAQNYFDSADQAKALFERVGFEVAVRSFTEVRDEITSDGALGLSEEEVYALLAPSVAFVMTPR